MHQKISKKNLKKKYKNAIRLSKINKKNKISLQYGGEETELLLNKMRKHKGEFVLVIGSNYSEPWCLEFANSTENRDKMVVSIDSMYESDNNFKFDFNKEENWKILHEFDGRFRTIIFDYSVDHFIHDDIIDIYKHIKQLLIVGGKMYKYFSKGTANIPNFIQGELITRPFTETDISIIKNQCPNIPEDILKLLQKIPFIKFIEFPYGLLGVSETYPDLGVNWLDYRLRDTASNDVLWYIKSLNKFYDNRLYTNLLEKVYNFDIQYFSNCIDYPLKNPL
jgi:hypothetical protein